MSTSFRRKFAYRVDLERGAQNKQKVARPRRLHRLKLIFKLIYNPPGIRNGFLDVVFVDFLIPVDNGVPILRMTSRMATLYIQNPRADGVKGFVVKINADNLFVDSNLCLNRQNLLAIRAHGFEAVTMGLTKSFIREARFEVKVIYVLGHKMSECFVSAINNKNVKKNILHSSIGFKRRYSMMSIGRLRVIKVHRWNLLLFHLKGPYSVGAAKVCYSTRDTA